MENYLEALIIRKEAVEEDYEINSLQNNLTKEQIKSNKEKKIIKSTTKTTLFVVLLTTILKRIIFVP